MKAYHHEYITERDGPQSYLGADRTRRLAKGGGGGGQAYYANADELYGIQADTAKFMLGLGKEHLPGAVQQFGSATSKLFDPAYAARMEGAAATTAQQALDAGREARRRDMARYGINPGDGTWRSAANADALQGAALKAGSINATRMALEDRRLGAAKDYYSALVGMPSDSAAVASSAASGYTNLGVAADQRKANSDAAMGNIAALGYEMFFAADGGEVPPLRKTSDSVWAAGERYYSRGGRVKIKDGARCMAMGGLFKQPSAPPVASVPVQPRQQNSVAPIRAGIRGMKLAASPGKFADKMTMKGGKIAEGMGNLLGDQQLAAQGLGMQGASTGTDMTAAIKAYNEAGMTDVAAGLGKGAGIDATTGLATAGSDTAAMLAAQDAAFGAGMDALTADALASGMGTTAAAGAEAAAATTGLTSALGTAAAAIPWIGAAVALGSLFDLFNEGGEVLHGRKDYTPGGSVTGPGDGTTTSDMVPAWLTEGEFVVNAEAVNHGDNRELLQKMNRKGLALRAARSGVRRDA